MKHIMNPITFWMTCKCLLTQDQLIYRGKERVCRKHNGTIMERKRDCLDCGKELILCKLGTGKFRCDDCQRESYLESQRTDSKARYVKREKRVKAKTAKSKKPKVIKIKPVVVPKKLTAETMMRRHKWRGEYCLSFSGCKPELTCSTCEEFSGIFFGHDPAKLP